MLVWSSLLFFPLGFPPQKAQESVLEYVSAICAAMRHPKSFYIYKSSDELFYQTEFEIWSDFGPARSTENFGYFYFSRCFFFMKKTSKLHCSIPAINLINFKVTKS